MSHSISRSVKPALMATVYKLAVFSILASGIAAAEAETIDQPLTAIEGEHTEFDADAKDTAEDSYPTFKFGGFGTLGVSHSSQRSGDYVLDGTMPKGPGRSNNWSATNDSRVGAQATANFTPKVSVVLQVISEYQADSTYRPTAEWANVKYVFTPDAYIRVGRTALPTFLNSDSRKIGYSYPWIHPPVGLYRQLSITNSDGLDVLYRFGIGEASNSVRAVYGRNKMDRPATISSSKGLWGVFDTFEYGPAILRVGYQERESSTLNRLTGVTGAWVRNSDLSVGASYDPGGWFIISEWIQRKSTSKLNAMYISGGYRIGKLTPYLSYDQNSPASFLPGYAAPTASSITLAKRSQSEVSLGVRWDFMKNTDFKMQYDQVRLGNDSNGYLANVPTGTILYGERFHVISIVLDFVF